MNASQRALLEGIMDYAGLFPPAKLPLDEAIRNYARFRSSPEGWLLGRFICPAARLGELLPFCQELFSREQPLRLSVLTTGGEDAVKLIAALIMDVTAMRDFLAGSSGRAKIEALETKLPGQLGEQPVIEVGKIIIQTAALIDLQLRTPMAPWYEAGPGLELERAVSGIAAANKFALETCWLYAQPAGFKLRCGGLEATAVPQTADVAKVLALCPVALVGLKATAGLHHPFRRFDESLQTHTHGFLNLFGASALAHTQWMSSDKILPILEDGDPSHFIFDEAGLRWGEHFAATAALRRLRAEMVTSFGSCSFEEPVADLHALGWL